MPGLILIAFRFLLIVIAIGVVLAAIANPIGNGEASTWVAAIVSTTITAPIFAIAVTVLYYDLAGGVVPSPTSAPAAPPPPN